MTDLTMQLLIASLTASGLYLIMKVLQNITLKYFSASWHYYSTIIVYLFFLIPYHILLMGIPIDLSSKYSVAINSHSILGVSDFLNACSSSRYKAPKIRNFLCDIYLMFW